MDAVTEDEVLLSRASMAGMNKELIINYCMKLQIKLEEKDRVIAQMTNNGKQLAEIMTTISSVAKSTRKETDKAETEALKDSIVLGNVAEEHAEDIKAKVIGIVPTLAGKDFRAYRMKTSKTGGSRPIHVVPTNDDTHLLHGKLSDIIKSRPEGNRDVKIRPWLSDRQQKMQKILYDYGKKKKTDKEIGFFQIRGYRLRLSQADGTVSSRLKAIPDAGESFKIVESEEAQDAYDQAFVKKN